MKQRIPTAIKYLLHVFVTGILFFTIFRIVLNLTNLKSLEAIPHAGKFIVQSMWMGFRFDTVISGYILALPAVVLVFAELFKVLGRRLLLFFHWFVAILYSLSFFICTADIPFFNNYNNRLNITILNWTSSPGFMIKMIVQDKVLLGYFFFYVVLTVSFIVVLTRVYKKYADLLKDVKVNPIPGFVWKYSISLVFFSLMFLGIRGRTDEKSPIVVGTAYFCSYDFLNQAGLNPVYTFMQSWLDGMKDGNKKLEFMNDQEAIGNVQDYLGVSHSSQFASYPLFRNISGRTPAQRYNVVVVLMESMSAFYLAHFGNSSNLTPNLDSLADRGYFFSNFYSAGIHTFNGIFSSLYSYPALMARHTMEGTVIPAYTGLPFFLKQRGYETIFFMTHDDQFDNIGGFLTANHVQTIISKKDYPSEQVMSTLGVPDHYMFNYAIPKLNDYYNQHKPFLAILMTTSNHNPYVIPTDIPFKPAHTDVRGGCVEYADWAIGYFMQQARQQPWFSNTIFVFTGDHGAYEGSNFGDLPINYSHVPCIILMPPDVTAEPRKITSPAGQVDIFPTIAGLLGGDYTNNTMGMDVLNERRSMISFSQDDKLCAADSNQLYVWHTRGNESIFNLQDGKEQLPLNRAKADSMKKYAFSTVQAAQWMLYNKATGQPK